MKEKILLEIERVLIGDMSKEDPKRIISVAFPFDGDEIEVMRLAKIIPVKEKASLPLPNVDNQRYYARLFSVQILKNGNRVERIFIEAAGNISSQVKLTAEKIVSVMLEKGMTSAFFPAYEFLAMPIMPVRCYFSDCFGVFHLKAVNDANIRNVRVLNGDYLLYTIGNRVMKIKMNDAVNNRWPLADVIHKAENDILYLDRVQNNAVIATGDGFIISIDLAKPSTSIALNHEQRAPHAFLKLKEFSAVAVISGDKISLTPMISAAS